MYINEREIWLPEQSFEEIKNKTAEVLKLLPQGANAHNVD